MGDLLSAHALPGFRPGRLVVSFYTKKPPGLPLEVKAGGVRSLEYYVESVRMIQQLYLDLGLNINSLFVVRIFFPCIGICC